MNHPFKTTTNAKSFWCAGVVGCHVFPRAKSRRTNDQVLWLLQQRIQGKTKKRRAGWHHPMHHWRGWYFTWTEKDLGTIDTKDLWSLSLSLSDIIQIFISFVVPIKDPTQKAKIINTTKRMVRNIPINASSCLLQECQSFYSNLTPQYLVVD